MSAEKLPAISAPGTARPQRPAETHLRLRGLTADGERLLLVDPAGLEFTVDIDARMRAALHGDPSRSPAPPADAAEAETPVASSPAPAAPRGPAVEKTMESMLRPRDIQARIRAGETPEAVAEAARTTLDKVMPYAAPVLAEREHVAERALRASIRRPAGDPPVGTSRTLGEAVSARLRAINVDPDTVTWDAWRREDGRWSLTASFSAGGTDGLARLSFDQRGNFVLLDNDEARWLVGDAIQASPAAGSTGATDPARALSAVPAEAPTSGGTHPGEPELGTDAIELVSGPDEADTGMIEALPIDAYLDVQATEATAEIEPVLPGLDERPLAETPLAETPLAEQPTAAVGAHDPAADEPPSRPARKKRASVPSWDEILFGPSDEGSAER